MPVIFTQDSEHANLYLFSLQKLWQWAELIAHVEAAIERADFTQRKDVIIHISSLSYAPIGTFERLTQIVLMAPPLNGGMIVIATSNVLITSYVRLFQRITPRAHGWMIARDLVEARALILESRQQALRRAACDQGGIPHKPAS